MILQDQSEYLKYLNKKTEIHQEALKELVVTKDKERIIKDHLSSYLKDLQEISYKFSIRSIHRALYGYNSHVCDYGVFRNLFINNGIKIRPDALLNFIVFVINTLNKEPSQIIKDYIKISFNGMKI